MPPRSAPKQYPKGKAKKSVTKKEVSSDSSDDSDASVASDPEVDDEDEGEMAKDGMADMMAKILNQKTSRAIPVLEKRNTTIMKSIAEERDERNALKKAQQEKAMIRNKQVALPGHSSIEKEKMLRKLATKGVVALFNAVAEAQRMEQDLADVDASGDKEAKKLKAEKLASVDIKKMSKDNFLDLLTGDAADTSAPVQSDSDKSASDNIDDDDDDDDDDGPATSWGALRDDYFEEDQDGSGRLKDWNKNMEDDVEGSSDDSDADSLLDSKSMRSSVAKDTKKRSGSDKPSKNVNSSANKKQKRKA
jgi:hypothetical protein